MKLRFRYTLLALSVISSVLHAQQFSCTGSVSMATPDQPVYQSTLLHSPHSTPNASGLIIPREGYGRRASYSGSILSEDAFSSRRTFRSGASSSGGGYSGIAGISAYQNLSVGNIGGGGPRLIGPPPPTPDPDDDDINQQLPIGDAWWLLLLMAGGYGITIFRRQRKSNK